MAAAGTSPYSLHGRSALVSGAGSVGDGVGIGRACAVVLARLGATVAVLDRDRTAADRTLSMITEEGGTGTSVVADLAEPGDIVRAVERCGDELGGPDILVNNVGIVGPPGTAVDLDLHAWHQALQLNVTAMVELSSQVIPRMRGRGGGSIVNVGSVAGLGGGYPHLSYATTKGAIGNLTRAMAGHHGADGIRVNAIAPGQLETPRILARRPSDEMLARRREVAPLGTAGTGWDAAYAVGFLVSEAARWITGVVLPVDAGLSAVLPLASPSQSTTEPEEDR